MLPAPSYFALVLMPMIAPIVASPSDIIVIWPNHPTHTLTVYARGRPDALRHGHVPPGALYGQILMLAADGVIDLRMRDGTAVSSRRRAS